MKDPELNDRLLVKQLLQGKEEAFEEFFRLYFPGLYRFALIRLEHNPDAAEEVVQRVLCRAISKLETYRGEAALFTWLCTFCRFEILHYLKDRNRHVTLLEDTPEIQAALESLFMTGQNSPDEAMIRQEVAQYVRMALDALPPKYSNVLEWKYMEGISVKEIAERLNLRFKAAESVLTRARDAFRDAFVTLTTGVAWESNERTQES